MTTDFSSQILPKEPQGSSNPNPFVQLEISFIMLILKQLTDKDHPLSANEIAEKMNFLTKEVHNEKTMSRKLKLLLELQTNPEQKHLYNLMYLTYGGYIVEIINQAHKHSKTKKKQSKFYFEPLLTNADVDFICASIKSNRYFSESEKDYLISREETLSSLITNKDNSYHKFKRKLTTIEKIENDTVKDEHITKIREKAHELVHLSPKKPSPAMPDFLKHVNELYHAIQNDYMISLIYGVYDSKPNIPRAVSLQAKNEKKPYKLNPYAMLWNNGAFYLIATHKGHSNPVHFRVDRIISITPIKTEDDATKFQKRENQPETLNKFFQNEEFLPEIYTAYYPLMSIYDDTNYISCKLECTVATSSILIDTFGTNLIFLPPEIPHNDDEKDFHNRTQKFLTVKISNVQYDNILQFCLQQHTSITAISPPQLVEDIQKNLEKSLNKSRKYQAILEKRSN